MSKKQQPPLPSDPVGAEFGQLLTHDEDFIVANVGQPGEKARQWYAPNRYLAPNNLQEWLNSCVDEALIRLNVISLSGYQPYEYLCYGLPNSERRNDGRLRDKWLQRYSHTEEGGWWLLFFAQGFFPHTNFLHAWDR